MKTLNLISILFSVCSISLFSTMTIGQATEPAEMVFSNIVVPSSSTNCLDFKSRSELNDLNPIQNNNTSVNYKLVQEEGKNLLIDSLTGEPTDGIYRNELGDRYYLDINGETKKGLVNWNGNTYYCKETSNGKVQYGLQWVQGQLYYFNELTGAMEKNGVFQNGDIECDVNNKGDVTFKLPGNPASVRSQVLIRALAYISTPYLTDQIKTDPSKGLSCSSFVQTVFNEATRTNNSENPFIETNAVGRLAMNIILKHKYGREISRDELRPGDLVFWQKTENGPCEKCQTVENYQELYWNEIHHVGIYFGAGKVIEASQNRGAVVIQDIESYDGFRLKYCASLIDDQENQDYHTDSYFMNQQDFLKTGAVGSDCIQLKWIPQSGAGGYIIYRKEPYQDAYVPIAQLDQFDQSSYSDQSVNGGDVYSYQIQPYCLDSENNYIYLDVSNIGTSRARLSSPTVRTSSSENGNPVLKWDEVKGDVSYYRIGKLVNGKDVFLAKTSDPYTLEYTDISSNPSEKSIYTVRAVSTEDNTDYYGLSSGYIVYQPESSAA